MSLYFIVFYIQLLFRAGLFCRWIWKEIYDDEFYWSIQVFSRVSLYYQAFISQSSTVCAERLSDFTPVETCSSGSVCVWLVRICPDVHVCHENVVSLWKSTNKFCLNDVMCGAGFSLCVCLTDVTVCKTLDQRFLSFLTPGTTTFNNIWLQSNNTFPNKTYFSL